MNQEELREQYVYYCLKPTLDTKRVVLDLFSNVLLKLVQNHHQENLEDNADAWAKVIIQMILSKSLYLQKMLEGISFKTDDGTNLPIVLDPTTLAVLIRNLFETVSMFNLIYRAPKSNEEKEIVYNLWVIAGLSYRQRFESNIIQQETRKKFENEQQEIQKRISTIESNALYKQLDQRNQEKIKTRIKQKEYLMQVDNQKDVKFLAWHDMITVMGVRPKIFDNMYTYFSLYAHPSHVSVFQFGQLFGEATNSDAMMLSNFNVEYVLFLLSIFVADYIHLFPYTKPSFEKMPLLHQLIIDHHNRLARGNAHSINDCYKTLG